MTFNNKVLGILGFVFFAILAGCGQSPIANHREKEKAPETPPLLLTTNCQLSSTKGTDFCGAISLSGTPILGKANAFTIQFWKKSESTSTGPFSDPPAKVTAFLQMPECGCQWNDVVVEKTATGTYRLSNVYFTKKGVWDLHVQVTNEKAIVDEFVYPFTL
jgi:hypothetical protein